MNKVLVSLIFTLIITPMGVQATADAPHLVVGITVDQLRSDYLQALQQHFGEKGFKRIIHNGVVCNDVVFDFPHIDRTVASATIHTGTIPFYNGIVAEKVFNTTSRKEENILHDPQFMGNATEETFSATALKVSSLSDEVKIVGNGLGRVYSVAPEATMAIIAGGHIANSALWIDDKTGRWVTTTYYYDAPTFMVHPYYAHSPAKCIDTITWQPLLAPEQYTALPYHDNTTSFTHSFSRKDFNRFSQFKTSPYVNTLVTDATIDLIKNASLGQRGKLDMINVGYTLAPFNNGTVQEYGLELQDAYIRLDADLSRLFDTIESTVGIDNTVIFITSTGYFTGEGREPSFYKIQSGEFYPQRAISLLNMYLMAIYGNGEWVKGYSHGQIYLNHELIKDKALVIDEVRNQAAQFLIEMEGVQDVYTRQHVLLHSTNSHTDRLRKGFSAKYSGDIFIELVPGWEIVQNNPPTRKYIRHNAVETPFLLLAPDVKPQKIDYPIDVTSIAPTVAKILRIRSPNGCTARALNITR